MSNTEAALQYGLALRGKICYSMSNRLGAGAMDCSNFVFRSLIAAGLLPKYTAIGNTETLFGLNGILLKGRRLRRCLARISWTLRLVLRSYQWRCPALYLLQRLSKHRCY